MSLYVEVAKRAFARHTTYRAANIAGLATNSFFGALRTYVFIGLYAGLGVVAGWTLDDAKAFVWVSQALIMPVYLWGWWEIAETIRSGDVVSDLSKPFDYYTFWLAQDAGRAVYHVIFRSIPTVVVGIVLFGVRLTPEPGRWLAFMLSVALAVWISFGLRFIVNVAAFWLLDYRGPGFALMFANSFFSGLLVPLVYWPDGARQVAGWLPFAGIIQAPVDVLLGKATGLDLAALLLFQAAWGAGLMLAGQALLGAAVRKVVVQGG
ncbi:MAG TPA: ABC-2 family transporter protein [Thermomicrobiales bacterium]|nr:ABC-2 family transporter protein [Thermomicrobiales bacterium]